MAGLTACGGGDDTTNRNTPGSGGVDGTSGKAGVGGAGTSGTAGTSGASGTSGAGTGATAGTGWVDVDAGGLPAFDAGDPSLNMVQAGAICDRLSTIQCAGEQHCCAAPNRTFEACKAEMMGGCTTTAYLDTISLNPITGFDGAYAATAFTQYEQMAAACDPNVTEWGASFTTGLAPILKGTVAAGGSCTPKGNIQDRAVIAAALASCTDLPTQACLPKAAVGGLPLSWKCSPKAAEGKECFTDVNCADGLYCDNPDFQVGGVTCKPRKAVGTPCTNPNECATLFCKQGVCVEKSMQAAYCLRND